MTIINTNMASIIATNAITANARNQEIAMERLSTGLRINSAGDDAAGLAISSRMQAEVTGLEMATRNANDAISMLETLEGSSREIGAALQRMRELAVQASSDTYGVTDRAALDLEFGQLYNELTRISTQTTWNEITLMNGANDLATQAVTATGLTIQLGKNAGQNMPLSLKSFHPATTMKVSARLEEVNPATGATLPARGAGGGLAARDLSNLFTAAGAVAGGTARAADAAGNLSTAQQANATADGGLVLTHNDNHVRANVTVVNRRDAETQAYGGAVLWVGNALDAAPLVAIQDNANPVGTLGTRIDILTRSNSDYALVNLDLAISAVSAERAKYGAYIARFEHAGDNLTNVARHQEQSRSRIADADYAVETTELSRTTIISQASTAMLAQANAAKQTVLTLLQ
jgi:flagellin